MKESLTFYPIDRYGNYFLAKGKGDNDWSVWSDKNGELKKMEGGIGGRGHIRYTLHTDDGKQVGKRLHQLIAELFIPIPQELLDSEEKLDVHHINGDKLDNRISNLVWMTASEHHSLHKKGRVVSEETKRKMSESQPKKQVYQYDMENNLIAVWPSTAECGRNGFDQGNVVNCCRGERKQHKGYKWSYFPL